jgi:hypothetical protein
MLPLPLPLLLAVPPQPYLTVLLLTTLLLLLLVPVMPTHAVQRCQRSIYSIQVRPPTPPELDRITALNHSQPLQCSF